MAAQPRWPHTDLTIGQARARSSASSRALKSGPALLFGLELTQDLGFLHPQRLFRLFDRREFATQEKYCEAPAITLVALKSQGSRGRSGDAGGVFREHLVDERLVPDAAPLGFLPVGGEDPGVQPDCNQPPRLVADRGPTDPTESRELLGRRRRDVRVINLLSPAPGTWRARRGSSGAR